VVITVNAWFMVCAIQHFPCLAVFLHEADRIWNEVCKECPFVCVHFLHVHVFMPLFCSLLYHITLAVTNVNLLFNYIKFQERVKDKLSYELDCTYIMTDYIWDACSCVDITHMVFKLLLCFIETFLLCDICYIQYNKSCYFHQQNNFNFIKTSAFLLWHVCVNTSFLNHNIYIYISCENIIAKVPMLNLLSFVNIRWWVT